MTSGCIPCWPSWIPGIREQSVNRKTLDDKAEGNNHQGIMASGD